MKSNTYDKIKVKNTEFFYQKNRLNVKFFHINNNILKDIYPIDVGYERHQPEDLPIENNYPYYLMHFVVKGRGYTEFNNAKTTIKKNTLFILPPDTEVKYYQDKKNPWEYYWINVNGLSVKNILSSLGFDSVRFFYQFQNNYIKKFFLEALASCNDKASQVYTVTACLMKIFEHLPKNVKPRDSYSEHGDLFEKILGYISDNLFSNSLSAKSISEYFFINPCYFSILFKKNMNVSFCEYINYERIKKATELIETTNLLIKEISESVGFSDPLYFSKVFRKYRMISPEKYRENILNPPSP